MTQRYKVIKGSQTAHCCFEATVVDTQAPPVLVRPDGSVLHHTVCECFDFEDAELICDHLNGVPVEDSQNKRDMGLLFKGVDTVMRDLSHAMRRISALADRVTQLESD